MSRHTIVLDRKTGKPKAPTPRMPAGQAKNKHQQAARTVKGLRENAAKARGKG